MSDLEQIQAMSDGTLSRALATEVMGWTIGQTSHGFHAYFEDGKVVRAVGGWGPAWNLNAVAEVEARLLGQPDVYYEQALYEAVNGIAPGFDPDWFSDESKKTITAPARQRAEACLLAWRRMKGGGDG